ncbi:Retrovirus-related Pol polyprotein from transposon TNT 1-94 [Eumeta japonica]|uniref:Retrovirus-related Pol polyprotein from transposon TNT 1-94 n=1 Tax=Eumeta variegata TaxID=151549 RepID=A0A4C1ZR34_EUMVA|nr:Retrovirus-related Pol polyprotein from transposon TNT 1-94 [Eumeta japonica]
MVERQTDRKIKCLRSDNGGEFANKKFDEHLNKCGIKRQFSVPYTPQQNGVAERANRTIIEMARSMLSNSGLNENLWAEAVSTAVYIRNRSPTCLIKDATPFEVFTGRKPCVNHFKVFGSTAVALDKTQYKKFQPKGKMYKMVGYSLTSKAYRLYDADLRIVVEKRDVYFDEHNNNNNNKVDVSEDFVDDIHAENNSIKEPLCEESGEDESSSGEYHSVDESVIREVQSEEERERKRYHVAGRKLCGLVNEGDRRRDNWRDAMQVEYDSLIKNETWTLVDLPKGKRTIGSKWVFSVKRDKNGSVDKFKARLVAKGCAQKYGIDYKETFSPQPECFVDKEYPKRVLRLEKAIYGLKQAGREWNTKLDEVLRSMSFTPLESERCLYRREEKGNIMFIAVYVDDIIIASQCREAILMVKQGIFEHFNCVDKGKLSLFLGIEIERDGELGNISISQRNYIEDLLCENNMEECRKVSTPLDAGFQGKCERETCIKVDEVKYQAIIGSLMYLALSTRPDILHSVTKLAQYNKNPHKEHLTGVNHVLRYLSATKNFKITYKRTGQAVVGYVDSDWGSDTLDRKSYSGFAFFMAGSVFSWESRKQQTVALSSTEAEYVALSTAAKEAIYLRRLLKEIGLTHDSGPIVIYGDNLGAQNLAKNHTYHSRTKHIDIKYNFLRDAVRENLLEVKYMPTNEMIADVLTKNLTKSKHCDFVNKLGLK